MTASAMPKGERWSRVSYGRSLRYDTSSDERLLKEMAAEDLTTLETVFARHRAAV